MPFAVFAEEGTAKNMNSVFKVLRQLRKGMSGDDIKALQEYLKGIPGIYPEGLVTGYFGSLTEQAVKRFQRKHDIEDVGEVGPKTRAKLNPLLEAWVQSGGTFPPGLQKKAEKLGLSVLTTTSTSTATSTQGLGLIKVTICHKDSESGKAKNTLTVGIPALVAHINHGDKIGACEIDDDDDDDNASTTPDTIPPVISGVTASGTASTSAKILWTTNESSNSTVWYASSSPVAVSTATTVTNTSLVASHELVLSPLTASTTYYYMVGSADASGNSSTSGESSFLTLP